MKPIEDKFLETRDLFGLEYHSGVVFFEVKNYSDTTYEPYSIGSVNSDGHSGYSKLEDNNNDILYLETTKDKVIQAVIGIRPGAAKMYTKYPDGGSPINQIDNISVANATSGDPYSNVSGVESPYNEPSDKTELFIPPGFHPSFDFYNPSNSNVNVDINIALRTYNVRVLDPTSDSNEVKSAIHRIAQPGSPAPIGTVGGPNQLQQYNMGGEWGVEPMSLSNALHI